METMLTLSPKLGHCEQQSLYGHAYAFTASDQPTQKIFISAPCGDAMFQI